MNRGAAATNPLGLSELEVACGVVCDGVGDRVRLGAAGCDPLSALEAVLRPLLERPPLVVAFSGGRDSSVLLAAAARVAAREGLPMPVAVTASWSGDRDSDEREWQETVIRSVGIIDWERFDPGVDLDLLGPVARSALLRHGLFWPAPAYALIPLIQRAHGGTLVTGEGGDEVFGHWPLGSVRTALAHRRLPSRPQAYDLLTRCSPRWVRYAAAGRSVRPYQTWLRPAGLDAQRWALAAERAAQPFLWPGYLAHQIAARSLRLTVRTLENFASSEGSRFVAPLVAEPFVASLGRLGGPSGVGDRGAVMTAAFEGLLPRAVLTRQSKASFGRVFWGPRSRAFAHDWSGDGLPGDLIDIGALRDAWLADVPVYGAALPLQAAWLATQLTTEHAPGAFPLLADLSARPIIGKTPY